MRGWICLVLMFFCVRSFAQESIQWIDSDLKCPDADALNHYLDVPMIPDLKTMAEVANIPNLNLHEDLQIEYAEKKWRIYFELLAPYDPQKEILILVPGGPGGSHTMLHHVKDLIAGTRFLDRYNVLAMDHRGVGCSRHQSPYNPPVESYKMRFAAADIEAIRKHLGGDQAKINLMGGSYGTMLGQTYALLFPKNLNRLVLMAAFSSFQDFIQAESEYEARVLDWNPGLRLQFDLLRREYPQLAKDFLKWSQGPMYSYFGRTVAIPEKMHEVFNLFTANKIEEAKTLLHYSPWVMHDMQRAIVCQEIFAVPAMDQSFHLFEDNFRTCQEFSNKFDLFNYTEILSKITARTFILGGEHDHVTPAFAMRRMALKIPNAYLYIDPELGHSLFEKPECIKQLLSAFFFDLPNANLRNITQQTICTDLPIKSTMGSEWPSE